jgi:hypothetical protein
MDGIPPICYKVNMTFNEEKTGYEKSIFSDLQGACTQGGAPQEVIENINYVDDILKEVLDEIQK